MGPIDRTRVRAREGDSETERDDTLAVEEPLEIRCRQEGSRGVRTFAITMRTPGHDEELAAGLLFAEGVLRGPSDLLSLGRPKDPRMDPEVAANVMIATVSKEASGRAEALGRGTVMGSACGVCGKTSIENVVPHDRPPLVSRLTVSPELLYALPARLREGQSIFSKTGGLHAAGLFSADAALRELREDIGRHNATDKLVGAFLLSGALPLSDSILLVSGRAGFEIVQKAFAAGIPILAAVSAPSSLAVELAETAGMTLIGFLRDRRFNVYSGSGRVRSSPE
ncbi:MAG TPA: formate dehydrogenase accessory sulfurtransferase FdhD [Candidatus Deferrimicrobium sp.]